MCRAELEPRWMSGRPAQVGHRDDRRHGAAPVAEPLEELERLLEPFGGLMHVGAIGSSGTMSSRTPPPRRATHVRHVLAGVDLLDEPRADPAELRRRRARGAPRRGSRRRRARGPARRRGRSASSAPSRSTSRWAGSTPRRAGREQVLPELQAGGELDLGDRRRCGGELSDLARQLGGAVVLLLHPEAAARRRRTSSSRCESPSASASAASSARPSRRSAGRRSMSNARSRASSSSSRSVGQAADGQRDLDDAQDLLGGVARPARCGWPRPRTARTPRRCRPPSRGARGAAGSPARARPTAAARRSRRGSPAAAAPRDGRREVADLLVREAVVGGRARLVLDQQAGGDGRRERGREVLGSHVPSLTRSSTSRRSFRLKWRPSTAASASAPWSPRAGARRGAR